MAQNQVSARKQQGWFFACRACVALNLTADIQSSKFNIKTTKTACNKLPRRLEMWNKKPMNTSTTLLIHSNLHTHLRSSVVATEADTNLKKQQPRPWNPRTSTTRSEMLSHGQWCLGWAYGERCCTGLENQFNWLEEGAWRVGEAIQDTSGWYGEMEGKLCCVLAGAYVSVLTKIIICRRRTMFRLSNSENLHA